MIIYLYYKNVIFWYFNKKKRWKIRTKILKSIQKAWNKKIFILKDCLCNKEIIKKKKSEFMRSRKEFGMQCKES